MSYQVKAAPVGSRFIDTVVKINPTIAASLKAAGVDGVFRYLGSIDSKEVSAILGAGLMLGAVCFSRAPGWQPSASIGASDGASMVAHAKSAGLLPGMTLWVDFEGPSGTATDQMAYINSCADQITAAGYVAGLYVGLSALNPAQLFSTRVHAYWKSLSNVPTPTCGFQVYQIYPTTKIANVELDVDFTGSDYAHRQPMVMAA